MKPEDATTEQPQVREMRLEGLGLGLVGVVLAALLALAFWAGRAYEARLHPEAASSSATLAAPSAAAEARDVAEDLTVFDEVAGAGRAAEPEREVEAPAPAVERAAEMDVASAARLAESSPRVGPAVAEGGPYFVQVFAGRDQTAADAVLQRLRKEGWAAQPVVQREGQGGQLVRVRVGGYRTEDDARQAAQELQQGGYPDAWIVNPG
jgi:cell division septation protein DedD